MELKNKRSAIIVGIASPSWHDPPVDQVLPLQVLPPLRPSLIVRLPVNLILRACDRYRERHSLILQRLLIRPAECDGDSVVTPQVSVLSSSRQRIEYDFERVCNCHAN